MKPITYIFLFLTISVFSFGQSGSKSINSYLSIINSEQVWIAQTATGFSFSDPFRYTYSADSVLVGGNYYFNRMQSGSEIGPFTFDMGYYREEGGRLYQLNGTEDLLMVDMSMEVGDSIVIDNFTFDATLVAVAIDSIEYDDNVYRKRIELQCTEYPEDFGSRFWVEGIGELFSGAYCVFDGGESILNCVVNSDGEPIYQREPGADCWLEINSCATDEYDVGDGWIYETAYYVTQDYQEINYTTKEILDTVTIDGKLSYAITYGDTFYVEEDKMYFWDQGLGTFEMYYDFGSTDDYTIRYYDQFTDEILIAEIKVDSVYYITLNNKRIGARDISVYGSNSHPAGWKGTVYDYIGLGWDGPKIDLDCGLCDPTVFTQQLRCFDGAACSINLMEYECDSTFALITAVTDVTREVKIYPNPTNDILYIAVDEIPLTIEVYDVNGDLVLTESTVKQVDTKSLRYGVYFLRMHFQSRVITRSFVKAGR